MPVIQIKNITKTYYGDGVETQAVKGVSFEVKKGEFISIMGPSGSGKSTLLHIIGLLDKSTSGQYIFDGKDTTDFDENELALMRNQKMGFIFQDFNLLPRTSVYDNVKLPLVYSNIDQDKWPKLVDEAIEAVSLSHRIKNHPSQLSGGEKQRVAIARVLVNNPEVIFADEPTGNLDTKNEREIMELLVNLNKKGHTIILITHEKSVANYTDRLIFMRDGLIESDELIEKTNQHIEK
ncbi:MAG: ABC transporter ATP-binding protein [Patescibacteria group bacterium]